MKDSVNKMVAIEGQITNAFNAIDVNGDGILTKLGY